MHGENLKLFNNLIVSKSLSETFLIQRRIERNLIINV